MRAKNDVFDGKFRKERKLHRGRFGKKGSSGKAETAQQERLLTAEEMIKSIMDCVQDYMIIFDEKERVQYISESAIEKFGLEKEKPDRTIADFSKLRLNGHSLGELLMLVDRSHSLNEMVRVETRDYLKEPWWAAVNAYLLTGDNNSCGILLILKDVTEYLRKTEKEIESNLVRENLLYTVSHCVKTSLNAIVGTVDLMYADHTEHNREQHLFTLRQASEKMVSMLDEVLDFTKAESGKLELREKEYAVIPMLEQLYSYARQAEEQGKRLYMFVSTDIPKAIIGDAKRVQQAISNLLYIFMVRPAKGSRAVELHVTTVEQDVAEIMLKVEVRGSSSAMPNIIQKVGGKGEACFCGYDSSEILCEFKYYAVVDLVRLMGGEIYAEQRASGTTVISFTVPLMTGASENIISFREFTKTKVAIDAADEHLFLHLVRIARELNCELVKAEDAEFIWSENTIRAPYSTMIVADYMRGEIKKKSKGMAVETVLKGVKDVKVLIVDDNEVNRIVAEKLLSTLGAVSETAQNGLQALEMTERKDYDVILMDHLMPEMDGVEATRKIREREEAAGRKKSLIIALTANLMESVVQLFEEAGADVSLAKPMDIRKLREVLGNYLPEDKLVFGEEKVKYQEPVPMEEKIEQEELDYLKSEELKHLAVLCPELDLRKGLTYVAGDEEQYLRVLNATRKSISQILEHFDTLALSETKELYIDIHSLKGIFANVGAERLREEAIALEHSLAEDGKLQKEAYRRFFGHCSTLEARLEQCVPQTEAMNYIPLSEEETKEWRACAKKALHMFDFDLALEAVSKLAAAAEGEARKNLLCVIAEIENFNYDSALELLEKTV